MYSVTVPMSLLYDQPTFVTAKFTLRSSQDSKFDTVLISKSIWNLLDLGANDSRVCICIEPHPPTTASYNTYDHILGWAEPTGELDNLAIPPSWHTIYNNVFGADTSVLRITLHNPSPLQEVILSALSTHAYDLAKFSPALLEAWFSNGQRIVRSGTTYELDIPNQRDSQAMIYRLESSTPVLQGYVKSGFTNFVVTIGDSAPIARADKDIPSGPDGFEIGEDFLASSIQQLPGSVKQPIARPSEEQGVTPPLANHFLPVPYLAHPTEGDNDNDTTLYVRTADLLRLGALDGDWLLAGSSKGSKQKLVRVRADDRLLEKTGVVVGSPTLLQNIFHGGADSDEHDPFSGWVSLHPSRLRGDDELCLPLAQSVTVTGIASPLIINKAFQPLLLQHLKKHFQIRVRSVQQGDIIAVLLDTNENHLAEQIDGKLDEITVHGFPFMPSRLNSVAFFRVINVVPETVLPDSAHDFRAQYKTGDLGCRIDPFTTCVVQQGIEQSHIPYLHKYFGNWSNTSSLLNHSSSRTHFKAETVYDDFLQVAQIALMRNSIQYNLHFSFLLHGPRGVGKYTVVSSVAQQLGMHLMEVDCYDITGNTAADADAALGLLFKQARSCSPCILVLRHIEAFANIAEDIGSDSEWSIILDRHLENSLQRQSTSMHPLLVVATASDSGKIPLSILDQFKHRINCQVPNESQRLAILNSILATAILSPDVSLNELTSQTAAFVPSDLVDLSQCAKLSSIGRHLTLPHKAMADTIAAIPLTSTDFDIALKKARASYSETIGAPSIPQVSWDDVGGLAAVKADILDTIQLPLEHPEVFADGLKKRSGILLYGPPGTGKTLVAKAVATSCSLNFLSVKGPELLDMYIGESEANVRKVFQRARDAAPCVIFFDELDSIAPKRGIHGDSGGVMDRIVSQLLAELDGAATMAASIFVIGATNRPDLLDSALLRPGRFDKMVYLGFSDTHDAQVQILRALTRKFRLDPELDLLQLAKKCGFSYTGADYYALCSDAMLIAMSRKADEVEYKIGELNRHQCMKHPYPITAQYYLVELAKADEVEIVVRKSDFDMALESFVPSVSQVEMEHYTEIRRRFLKTFT